MPSRAVRARFRVGSDSAAAPVARLRDSFYCRSKRVRVSLESCLDAYLDANTWAMRRSACFRCPVGRGNRERFAEVDGCGVARDGEPDRVPA